jgi:hypothetical protein
VDGGRADATGLLAEDIGPGSSTSTAAQPSRRRRAERGSMAAPRCG